MLFNVAEPCRLFVHVPDDVVVGVVFAVFYLGSGFGCDCSQVLWLL